MPVQEKKKQCHTPNASHAAANQYQCLPFIDKFYYCYYYYYYYCYYYCY